MESIERSTHGDSHRPPRQGLLAGARIPTHLAVIPDGNRRWAREHGLPSVEGHRAGFEVARRLARFCRRVGIHTTTVWAFSTENWRRSRGEIGGLFALYEEWIYSLLPEAADEEVRIVHIGRRDGLPAGMGEVAARAGFPGGLPRSLLDAIDTIEARTASLGRNLINLAINYGGADEIQRSLARLIEHARTTGADASALDIHDFLDTAGQPHPNPDMLWRTSGEYRSSGFLPLQSAYAELIFTSKCCPELTEDDLIDALLEYSLRARRFGR